MIAGTLVHTPNGPQNKEGAPWFGALSARLTVKQTLTVPKAATDGTHMFINPQWVDSVTVERLCFTWAHEVLHCGLGHMWRKPDWCDWHEWNICTDLAINGILIPMCALHGWEVPTDVVYDAQYDGWSAEQIAHARRKEREQLQQQNNQPTPPSDDDDDDDNDDDNDEQEDDNDDTDDSAEDQEQSEDGGDSFGDDQSEESENDPQDDGNDDATSPVDGDDGESEDHETGGGTDGEDGATGTDPDAPQANSGNTSGLDAGDDCLPPYQPPTQDGDGDDGADADNADDRGAVHVPAGQEPALDYESWQEAVEQAMAVSRKAGAMPGSVARAVEQGRENVNTNWREVTRQWVEQVAPSRQTWSRPNRRHIGRGVYLPARQRENLPPLLIGVDTSGSITAANLRSFNENLQTLWVECKPRELYVVYCDTRVSHVEVFTQDVDQEVQLHAYGGGGTEFQPVFDYAQERIDTGEWEAPAACIYLTDLECWSPPLEPDWPVLWACVPGTRIAAANWLFGETVVLS